MSTETGWLAQPPIIRTATGLSSYRRLGVESGKERALINHHQRRRHLHHKPTSHSPPAFGRAMAQAVAAVVHRWMEPLAPAPGAHHKEKAYSTCRRNRASHAPERSHRPRV